MLVSFIMPAKNSSPYIGEAVKAVMAQTKSCWELIIVEDHSDDETFKVAKDLASTDERIKLYKNVGKGKVEALNYGYKLSNGDIIKCIDSDDVIDKKFLDYCLSKDFRVMCHGSFITDFKLDIISAKYVNQKFVQVTFEEAFKKFLGIARSAWTFKRDVASKIFPIPMQLPFEDLWFSFVIKRYEKNIWNLKEPLYYYRQHGKQTYGGIYNYNSEIVRYRAERKLAYVPVLKNNHLRFLYTYQEICDLLEFIQNYLNIMASNKVYYNDIIKINAPFKLKIKLLFIKKFPKLSSIIKKYIDIMFYKFNYLG